LRTGITELSRGESERKTERIVLQEQLDQARLRQGRLEQFGKLLYESHESCRRLYECSSPELDTVVGAAKRAGALGARLTGAGWGGAAIVLVNKTDTTTIPTIQRAFERAYGRTAPISEVKASAGAHAERL